MTWAQFQQECELVLVRARWICAALVPAFYAVNQIWGFFSPSVANQIVGTFVALGFLTTVRGTLIKSETPTTTPPPFDSIAIKAADLIDVKTVSK